MRVRVGAVVAWLGLFAAVAVAQPAPITAQDMAAVEEAIARIGCEVAEAPIDRRGDFFTIDNAQCEIGRYDIVLDGEFHIVTMKREPQQQATPATAAPPAPVATAPAPAPAEAPPEIPAAAAAEATPVVPPAAAEPPAGVPEAVVQLPTLRPNEVCLYSEANFTGLSFCVTTGVSSGAVAAGWDNRISAIRVGANASIEVCGDTFFVGWCQQYREDVAQLPEAQDNAISSYRVTRAAAVAPAEAGPITPAPGAPAAPAQGAAAVTVTPGGGQPAGIPVATIIPAPPGATPPPPAGAEVTIPGGAPPVEAVAAVPPPAVRDRQVCFFSEANFAGESFCAVPNVVAIRMPEGWNDRISSIRIDGDVAIEVCQTENFAGWCDRVGASLAQLAGDRNNAISSFRFQ